MGTPGCSYALIVSCFVFLVLGPAMSAYADVNDEKRCHHKANKAERTVRKLERRESKACTKRFSDMVDRDYISEVSVQSRNDCWRQAEHKRAFRLGVIDDVRSQCLGAAGAEAWIPSLLDLN